ncbi:hypothetical protein [Pseudomonas sp. HS-18]|uniref:hypothetical protein n=1 Tax=Pseudomonas sp. HS-18 TaxID=2879114 RepID=UPI001CF02A3A|nr:hypothetical protein [Pseudomonas sp. HS-18]UCL84510.1 hypothetical protein LDJ84_16155 [Pseudomonas sp. HS-18]
MTEKKPIDWERIEQLYRAGVLSVREIAAACGPSHVAIHKRAKREGWTRDLSGKIKEKADSLVNTQVVNTSVNTEKALTERAIVDANAKVIADIRIAHRTDIGRSRELANKLLDELEDLTEERGTLRELIEQLKENDDVDTAMLELASKMSSLPSRTKTMKELAETLKHLILLERQAYGMDQAPEEEDKVPSGLGHFYGEPSNA